MSENNASNSTNLNRRSVVKGAAWAAPVIAVATAAPAMAASRPPVAPSLGPGSCKHTKGENRYHIDLIFTNTMACSTTVVITQFVIDPRSGSDITFVTQPTTFVLGPADSNPTGGADTFTGTYDSNPSGNIAQGDLLIQYTYTDCQGNVVTADARLDIGAFNPCTFDYPHPA